jgi:2-hydroxy-3-keto-5-methylthiopentenyl-1-phosphate phosphatase
VLARAWMHRRLWLNDPDCLMARTRQTELRSEEARTLAACIAATGGMVILSDDVAELDAEAVALVAESIALARQVDEAGTRGTARALSPLAGEFSGGVVARTRAGGLLALVNADDTHARRRVDLAGLSLPTGRVREGLLGSARSGDRGSVREFELAPHATALLRADAGRSLAVFCDFDGTFAVQDVGSSLARRHAGERRRLLWRELEAGKLSPWDYNLALLDGLALPEAELEAFLRSVELSPGARELVAWCERHGVPFRVLSDGFDYNLDRLQQLHGVRFDYDANHLHYEDGRWRIQARHPNPDCECGTGTCKRGCIERFRAERPDAFLVHIGNGRVSDLCAVPVVDLVFAKDSLAEELAARGVPFEPFESLSDVLPALERLLGETP